MFVHLHIFIAIYVGVSWVKSSAQKPNSCNNFFVCHWNLNGHTAYNFEKVGPLDEHSTVNIFHIICVSECYLDPSFSSDYENLNIKGHKLIRDDHANNTKSGGVCLFFLVSLPVRIVLSHQLSVWF